MLLLCSVFLFYATTSPWGHCNHHVALGCCEHAVSIEALLTASNVIHVPGDFTTIQDAINNAVEGETILVQAGTYEEALVISKSLSVIGSGNQSVIKNRRAVNSVEIRAANVTFANFTVDGCRVASSGIYVGNRTNVVENNTIINHRSNGIYLLRASLNVVRNNIVANNSGYGIHIYDSSGNILRSNCLADNAFNFRIWGLYLGHFIHDVDDSNRVNGKPIYYWINQSQRDMPTDAGCVVIVNSTEITVKDLNVSNNPSGIVMVYTNNSLVWNNDIADSQRGIYLISSFHNLILSNRITNDYWAAVSLISSSNNTIAANLIDYSKHGVSLSYSPLLSETCRFNNICGNDIRHSQYVGIYFDNAHENYVHSNNFDFNSGAIDLVSSNDSQFAKNSIANCTYYGIQIEKAANNTFFLNNFINNTLDLRYSVTSQVEQYANNWDNGTVGNYWSAYEGSDSDGDGFGDVPHQIRDTDRDRFPIIHEVSKNKPPQADFVTIPADARAFDNVLFRSNSSDQDGVVFYLWQLDGAELPRTQEPTVTFQTGGEYNVTLYVLDGEGSASYVTKAIMIRRLATNLTIVAPSESQIGENVSIVALLTDENRLPLDQCNVFLYVVRNGTSHVIGVSTTNSSGCATFSLFVDSLPSIHIMAEYKGSATYAGALSELTVATYEALDSFLAIMVALALSSLFAACLVIWRRRRRKLKVDGTAQTANGFA